MNWKGGKERYMEKCVGRKEKGEVILYYNFKK